ncbi:thiamine phosphate synthase [Pedobacter gandavensis]|uniref:thiamine phosphate synthase n=1 Tax=Pedobacter gandavensis TaxID=2679963 RepID=UPI002930C7F0|nr:thiamine phosphate synthase [Pedobacter gandavensis]
MELIVISKPNFFKGEAQLINGLFDQGMQRFHLRKEGAERRLYRQLLAAIEPGYLERIALHQFHELAPDFGIQRLHFKEQQRLALGKTQLLEKEAFTLSTSIHSTKLTTGLQIFKYTFISPVFRSISKENYPGLIKEGFQLPLMACTKLIALGGINSSRIPQLRQMNFEGAAVLGAIWNEPEQALKNFKQLQSACQTTA